MAINIIKNTTGGAKSWGGLDYAASSQYTIQEMDRYRLLSDDTFVTDLLAGSAVVNNGIVDLPPVVGLIRLRGIAAEYRFNPTPANGFIADDVQSAIEEAKNSIQYNQTTATASASTSSSTFSVINSMSVTPVAGTYIVFFNGSLSISTDDEGEIALFINAVQQTHTTRELRVEASGLLGAVADMTWSAVTTAVLTVDGTQAINVRFRAISGTITAEERNITILRVV